jgi:hypothetical protein
LLNVKTRFVGPTDPMRAMHYMDAPFMERLEVTLSGPVVNVPIYRPGEIMVGHPASFGRSDPIGSETRLQFGERLRRAAREATRGIEDAILKSLREQGHLV